MENLIFTVLHDAHLKLNAKMAPFGGFDMPIQYEGIVKEHEAVRTACGVFDTCHMGEFIIEGDNAQADLEALLTCPVASLPIGSCRYGYICNDKGGTIDDQVIYRLGADSFMMVVNASTRLNDFEWVRSHVSAQTIARDISDDTAKLDIQGPLSARIVNSLLDEEINSLRFYTFMKNSWKGTPVTVSRTGYTGELGYEVYLPASLAEKFWDEVLAAGAKPCGLGCRDTLRLEMGMPLYGHELNEKRNPAEAGFTRAIDSTKVFVGSKAVLDKSAAKQKLVALSLEGRRAARADDIVFSADGKKKIGTVTSGSFSPSLKAAIALAYVSDEYAIADSSLAISVGGQMLSAKISALPFYKDATGRKDINLFV